MHVIKRYLFWTDTGSQQAIYRSKMDGSERIVLQQNLNGVTAMTVDSQRDLIFYALESKKIFYMDLNGKNKYELI